MQQTSPQSLSPCLLGKLWTFSTGLNCKCSAPRADRLWNGSLHVAQCAVFFWHMGAPEGACTEPSLTGALSCSHISYLDPALDIKKALAIGIQLMSFPLFNHHSFPPRTSQSYDSFLDNNASYLMLSLLAKYFWKLWQQTLKPEELEL